LGLTDINDLLELSKGLSKIGAKNFESRGGLNFVHQSPPLLSSINTHLVPKLYTSYHFVCTLLLSFYFKNSAKNFQKKMRTPKYRHVDITELMQSNRSTKLCKPNAATANYLFYVGGTPTPGCDFPASTSQKNKEKRYDIILYSTNMMNPIGGIDSPTKKIFRLNMLLAWLLLG
jgi:hypothetical protein